MNRLSRRMSLPPTFSTHSNFFATSRRHRRHFAPGQTDTALHGIHGAQDTTQTSTRHTQRGWGEGGHRHCYRARGTQGFDATLRAQHMQTVRPAGMAVAKAVTMRSCIVSMTPRESRDLHSCWDGSTADSHPQLAQSRPLAPTSTVIIVHCRHRCHRSTVRRRSL